MKRVLRVYNRPLIKKDYNVELGSVEDEKELQYLNDRGGDDKFLGWLRRDTIKSSSEKKDLLVIRDEGQIVCFLIGNSRKDGIGTVYSICTVKEYRVLGLTKIILKHFLEKQPKKILTLKVLETNSAGVFSFTKLGGVEISREVNRNQNTIIQIQFNEIT